jgi:UDP-N-acetylmuramoyl-tripeptide--D-alanyl-D-alanine ligase
MLPLTTGQIREIVQGALLHGSPQYTVTGVAIDSRKVKPGDVFVAFVGEKVDGHAHVDDAFRRGASAAIVTKNVETSSADGAVIHVQDALYAMQMLAAHERSSFAGPVIGVTGSNGKTTTKDMLAAVFGVKGPCLATVGNHNNELGLPLTILERKPEHQSMVLEMGMRGMGQIATLCEIGKPTAGIITNIGQSHIEILGSRENIAKAKAELLEAVPGDGISALNRDDAWLVKMADRASSRVLWYSLESEADAYATDVQPRKDGISFTAHVLGQSHTVTLPMHGRHNIANALGALVLGAAHGIPLPDMADALQHMKTTGGRLQVKQGLRGWTVIDDSYNASPISMKASLSAMKDIAAGNPTVAVLGDMYELGDYAESGHREVGAYAAQLGMDLLIAIGPMGAWIAEAAREAGCRDVVHFADKQQALEQISELIPADATVLVKASRGMQLEDVVAVLTPDNSGADS